MEQISPQVMHRLVFTVLMQHLPDSQSGAALQILTDALKHTQTQVRELAVVAIAELPTAPPRRVQALAPGLADDSPRVRRRAARAIGDQGPAAQAVLPLLLDGLTDPDASVRRDCVGALGRLGPAAHAAAPHLVPLLGEEEARSRAVVAVALKRIGRAVVPYLLDGMTRGDSEVCQRCVDLLRQMAPDDARVQRALADYVDQDADTLDAAMFATKTPAPIPMPARLAVMAAS
jgi:HEAT repeat protein